MTNPSFPDGEGRSPPDKSQDVHLRNKSQDVFELRYKGDARSRQESMESCPQVWAPEPAPGAFGRKDCGR